MPGIDEAFKEAEWPVEMLFTVEQEGKEITAIEAVGIEPANLALKYCRLLAVAVERLLLAEQDLNEALQPYRDHEPDETLEGAYGEAYCAWICASTILADLTRALGEMK